MHFAAHAYVGESVENPRKYFRNDFVGALSLLNSALDAGMRRIVFSSSCAVYGVPSKIPITEQTSPEGVNPMGPRNFFSKMPSKPTATPTDCVPWRLRHFNAAGADESGEIGEIHNPEPHLIPLALAAATKNGRELQIYGPD